jgi:hypothetical protein
MFQIKSKAASCPCTYVIKQYTIKTYEGAKLHSSLSADLIPLPLYQGNIPISIG